MYLLANQCPPASVQASILVMAQSSFQGQGIVHELPCLRSIWSMQTALLYRTKSLAAYWLGSVDAWKQLHTNETSRRQISLVNIVVGLIGSDGILRSICLMGPIIAEDSDQKDTSFVGALLVYMGHRFFVQFLHEELCSSSKENILQMNMFIILRATDMIAQLHIASIIFITVVIPVRWLAGKTPAWPS